MHALEGVPERLLDATALAGGGLLLGAEPGDLAGPPALAALEPVAAWVLDAPPRTAVPQTQRTDSYTTI